MSAQAVWLAVVRDLTLSGCSRAMGSFMKRLDRYTPEICWELRQIAEHRNWRAWDNSVKQEEVLQDLELTYHLHAAAEAAGARAGFPAMPEFPIHFIDSEGILDPADFVTSYTGIAAAHHA